MSKILSVDIKIPHGHFKNVLLNEEAHLPNNVFALFIHRSSFNRRGIMIWGSIYDFGYEGQIGCSVYNLSGQEISIPKNERVGQMVFFKGKPASIYNGKYQGEHLKSACA